MKKTKFLSLSVMRYGFRGKSVAQSLGYLKPLKALHTHVDKEDKRKLSDLEGVPKWGTPKVRCYPKWGTP